MRQDDRKIDELTENVRIMMEKMDILTEEVKPLVEIYTNSLGTYKVLTGFFKLAAAVAAGVAAIIYLRKL